MSFSASGLASLVLACSLVAWIYDKPTQPWLGRDSPHDRKSLKILFASIESEDACAAEATSRIGHGD